MLSLRSPLRQRSAGDTGQGKSSVCRGQAVGGKENVAVFQTARGVGSAVEEGPHGDKGNGGTGALVRALAAARAEAADLRERLTTAAQRGVAVSRERHALSARVGELISERDMLRAEVEALRQAVQQQSCERGGTSSGEPGDGSRKAVLAALDAKRGAEAHVRALNDALVAARAEVVAARVHASHLEAEVDASAAEVEALRFQLRLTELRLTSARKCSRPRRSTNGSPSTPPAPSRLLPTP